MNIERGLIEINKNGIYILSVGHFYKINSDYIIPTEIKDNQKVLGINTGNKFDFCFNIELVNGKQFFGCIIKEIKKEYTIQRIGGYNKQFFNPFDSNYKSLLPKSVKIEEIKSIEIATF